MIHKLLIAGVIASFPITSLAEEWKDRVAGLDGVQMECSVANKEKYTVTICDLVKDGLTKEFEKASIPVVDIGTYRGEEEAPADTDKLTRPLETKINVRGTNVGGDYAINIRIQFSLPYKNAIENGSSDTPRDGDLVFWETTTVGVGPRKRLVPAISQNVIDKTVKEMKLMTSVWSKPE